MLQPIRSEALRGVRYDARSRTLLVQFRKGASMYQIYDVSPALFDAFMAAQPHPWSRYGKRLMRHHMVRVYYYAA